MTRRLRPPPRPLEFPEPGKPLAEMTASEKAAYLRQLRRVLRDDEVRRGIRTPRTMREIEIWREGEAEREKWLAEKIAKAGRRQAARAGRGRREDPGQREGPASG